MMKSRLLGTVATAVLFYTAITLALFPASLTAATIGYTIPTSNDTLYRITLETGILEEVGSLPPGYSNVKGLAFKPQTDELWGYDQTSARFFIIDPKTAEIIWTGPTNSYGSVSETTIGFDTNGQLLLYHGGNIYNVSDDGVATLDGKLEQVPAGDTSLTSLYGIQAVDDVLYSIRPDYFGSPSYQRDFNLAVLDSDSLYVADIGPYNYDDIASKHAGFSSDANGTLWTLISDARNANNAVLVTVDKVTGEATWVSDISCQLLRWDCYNFQSLAIETSAIPIPPAHWLFGSGLLGLIGMARRKST